MNRDFLRRRVAVIVVWLVIAFSVTTLNAETLGQRELARTEDGGTVTLDDLMARSSKLESWVAGGGIDVDDLHGEVEETLLVRLAAREALLEGLDQQPDVKAHLEDILSVAYVRSRIPESALVISAGDVEAFYRQNLEDYALPRPVLLQHLLFSTAQEAARVHERLGHLDTPNLSSFTENSLDSASSQTGAEIPWMRAKALIDPLDKVAAELNVGDYSAPVKSLLGYHIIRLVDKAPTEYQSLDDIRTEVSQSARSVRQRQMVEAVIATLWGKYGVRIDADAILQVSNETRKSTSSGEAVAVDTGDRDGARLVLLSHAFDLGLLDRNEVSLSIVFGNPGNVPLEIESVRTSCACLEPGTSVNVLAPGEYATLNVVVRPGEIAESGRSIHRIGIYSNSKREAVAIVDVSFVVGDT